MKPAASFSTELRALQDESGGVLDLRVVLLQDAPGIRAAASAGDRSAQAALSAVRGALLRIASAADTPEPPLCGCCPRVVGGDRSFALAIVTPARDDPRTGLALAICEDCATTRKGVARRATESLRTLWPELRLIEVSSAAGHA